jgi:hypothetical protein
LIGTAVITVENLVMPPYNWLPNPSFEYVDSSGNLIGWDTNITRIAGGYASDYAGKIASPVYAFAKTTIRTDAGEIWRFRAWAKHHYLGAGFALQILDSTFNPISTLSQGFTGSDVWVERTWQFTIPSNGKYIVPGLIGCVAGATFDLVSLQRDVGEINIGDGQITAPKIAANAITSNHIQAGAITADKIAAGQVTTEHIRFTLLTSDPTLEAGKMWYRSDLDELRFASGTTYDKVMQIPKIPLGAPLRALYWFRSTWLPSGCERVVVSGSGSTIWNSDYLVLQTGTTAGSTSRLEKDWSSTFSNWGKRRIISALVCFFDIAYTRTRIWTGALYKTSGIPCFGVYVDNNSSNTSATLYGFSWDGSAGTDISLCSVTEVNDYLITMEFVPGQAVKFYVNNTLVGIITTNLPPSTSGYGWGALRAEIYNYTASNKLFGIYQTACMQEL